MTRRFIPVIILTVLASLTALWLNTRLALDLTRATPAGGPAAVLSTPALALSGQSLSGDAINARNVFNSAPANPPRPTPPKRPKVIDCQPADASLTLEGTAVFDQAANFAVVEAQGEPRLVRAGQTIQGHTVRRIGRARVVMERDGAPVCLTARRPSSASTNRATQSPKRSEIRKLGTGQYQVDRTWFRAQLKDLPTLAKQVKVRPLRQGNRMVGFTVARLQKGSAFERLGLRAGDVLVKANGEALDNPGRILRLYHGLAEADGVTVQITRRGRPMTLDFAVQ